MSCTVNAFIGYDYYDRSDRSLCITDNTVNTLAPIELRLDNPYPDANMRTQSHAALVTLELDGTRTAPGA